MEYSFNMYSVYSYREYCLGFDVSEGEWHVNMWSIYYEEIVQLRMPCLSYFVKRPFFAQ